MITIQLTIIFYLLCVQPSIALLISSPSVKKQPHTYRLGYRTSTSIVDQRIATKTSLSSLSPDATSVLLSSNDDTVLKSLAEALGYLIGAASVLLYTPIAVRIVRTKSASGLAVSTWWLKLTSFTCTDIYNIRNGFPIAAYSESIIITVEAIIVLGLVTYYQHRLNATTFILLGCYIVFSTYALYGAPDEWINIGQVTSIILSTSALLPQLKQNADRQTSGDYSPITASLTTLGCILRIFTTVQLANSDTLILLNYGVALLLNLSVLAQIVYFGTQKEEKTLTDLFLADVKSAEKVGD